MPTGPARAGVVYSQLGHGHCSSVAAMAYVSIYH